MGRYGIKLYTSMPSVYGDTQLKFDKVGNAIAIESSLDNFFRTITDQVNQKIRAGRAVIVFFEAAQRLGAFCGSAYFKKVPHANVLNESLDPKARDYVIRKAATYGQATFASAAFGRGTDFFCKDSKLAEAGGVHVLQAFFSLQKADEVQIQGRTARQGKQGTYGLVLLQSDLKDSLGLEASSFDRVAQCDQYSMLDMARAEVHTRACKVIEDNLTKATALDQLTHTYFDTVLMGQRNTAVASFQRLFKEIRPKDSQVGGSYHVIFLVDTSGSMLSSDAVPTDPQITPRFPNRLGCALEACDRFVRLRNTAGASDVITLISFDSSAKTVLRSQALW